jgi:nicotinamide N-methyltransferase
MRRRSFLLHPILLSMYIHIGHVLYPAAIILSRYVQEHSTLLFPETQFTKVLELGAGGGLPGITCVLQGANLV